MENARIGSLNPSQKLLSHPGGSRGPPPGGPPSSGEGGGPPRVITHFTQGFKRQVKSTTIPVAGQKISWNDQDRKAVDPPEDPLMKSRGFCILQIPRFSILRYCSHFCLWLFYGPKTLFSSDIQVYSLISGDHLFFHEDHAPRQFPFQNTIGIWKMLLLENDEIRIETCIFWEKRKLVWEGKCSLWWVWTSILLSVTLKLLYLAPKK